jgi:hypothetical protein
VTIVYISIGLIFFTLAIFAGKLQQVDTNVKRALELLEKMERNKIQEPEEEIETIKEKQVEETEENDSKNKNFTLNEFISTIRNELESEGIGSIELRYEEEIPIEERIRKNRHRESLGLPKTSFLDDRTRKFHRLFFSLDDKEVMYKQLIDNETNFKRKNKFINIDAFSTYYNYAKTPGDFYSVIQSIKVKVREMVSEELADILSKDY